MHRPLAALVVNLCAAWLIGAGCTAAGSTAQVNGPAYDLEAGGEGPTDAAADVDAAVPMEAASALDGEAPPDGAPPEDAARVDGATPGDAADGGASGNDGAGADAGCTSTTVILGGSDLSLFGATATGSGPFAVGTLTGSLAAAPAIAPFGGGFQALIAEASVADGGSPLVGVSFAGGAWSAPSALGGNATTIDAPAIAPVGSTLQGAYLNPDHLYFHASFGNSWDTGADPVRPSNDAGGTAFGPVRPAAAGAGTDFVIAYEGNDLLPYAQTWTSAAGWDDGVALGGVALLPNTAMAIAQLGGGGASDLVAVYVDGEGSSSTNNLHLFFTLRSATTKTWSSPAMVGVNAFTTAAPALTTMSAGRALLAWRGQSGGVYGSVLTPGGAPTWSSPVSISAATSTTTPSLAPGVCGDDAVVAYVSVGSVYTAHFAGGTWTAPALLGAEAGVTNAAIATTP